jgi:osmotically-inducible protein OsmY
VTAGGEHPTPEAYVVAHVREALATDGRVAELGIDVTAAGSTLVLLGRVASTGQRDEAAVVAAERAPGYEIRNELEVVDDSAPPAPAERLS